MAKRGTRKKAHPKARSAKPAAKKRVKSAKPAGVTPVTPVLLLPARAASVVDRNAKRHKKALHTHLVKRRRRWAWAGASVTAASLIAAGLILNIIQLNTPAQRPTEAAPANTAAYAELRAASTRLSHLEAMQAQAGADVVDTAKLEQQLAQVQVALESNDGATARSLLAKLRPEFSVAGTQLAAATAITTTPATDPASVASVNVPILLYHQPPEDFDNQMDILHQRGYTTVTLDDVAAALTAHGTLPPKPVVITFDDGFASQRAAADYLAAHQMKATFFIIAGGAASNYCIGANRHADAGCGDAYLSWREIKALDHNPLFTIASHTVDHLDLPQHSPDVQKFQIDEGKQELEQHIGHRVDDFAYPYGDFDATTLSLVHQAGFIAAVSTVPGSIQTADALLTLKRTRDTYSLP